MKQTNTNFNAFLEELEALIGRFKEDLESQDSLNPEIPPEDIFAHVPDKEGIDIAIYGIKCSENVPQTMRITLTTLEVPPNRNQCMQIDDIEIGNRPEATYEPKTNWWHIGDVEFFT